MADSRDGLGKQNSLRVSCSIRIPIQKTKGCLLQQHIHTKIGTVQRFSWPLYKDNMQIGEAFHISVVMYILSELKKVTSQENRTSRTQGQNQNNWIIT